MQVSCKALTKFCVVYAITLLILLLIFTAFHNQPLDQVQNDWWWGFLGGLILSISWLLLALTILLYTDYHEAEPSFRDVEASLKETGNGGNSNSYKTVLTVSSMKTDRATPQASPAAPQLMDPGDVIKADSSAGKFVNMTPIKNAVTVVDVPAMNAARRKAASIRANSKVNESANLANISSGVLKDNTDAEPKETTKTSRRKKKGSKRKWKRQNQDQQQPQ